MDPKTSSPSYRELEGGRSGGMGGKLLGKVGLWMVLAGPVGALAVLLWERDAIVRQKTK